MARSQAKRINMKQLTIIIMSMILLASCSQKAEKEFEYSVDKFADVEILRYKVNNFDSLT